MHHASEKMKRGSKNPKVSVRLNVRPLRGNWKPVKRYECDGAPRTKHTASPAEEQLDCAIWKTKNVRTDIMDSVAVKCDEVKKIEHISDKDQEEEGPVVTKCACANCEKADDTPTALELSPREYRECLIQEKKNRKQEKSKKQAKSSKSKASSSKHGRRRRHHRSYSSPRPPSLLAPPNSVVSRESNWCKLYEDASHPIKLIDPKKIHTVPGQIGMSDLEPEDPATPPSTANEIAPVAVPLRSPNLPIMQPLVMSPPSNVSELYNLSPPPVSHQPPLVPQIPTQPQPNVVILPAPVDNPPTIIQNQNTVPRAKSDSSSSLVFMPNASAVEEKAIPSTSNASMIRKMENLFYNSESNWWFLVALIMLTIFAYRSSIEQHTCYYD
ncbi:unnamed protein product [Caenorhabditis nigoni]